MKSQQESTQQFGAPRWLHDETSFYNMLPNGARLKAGSVPSALTRTVKSGSIVGRVAGNKKYIYVDPAATALTSDNATTVSVLANAAATVISVADTDGFVAAQAITIGGEARTIASVDSYNSTITITAGLTAQKAVGAAVVLTTPVAYTELYLNLTDILDVNVDDTFTLLRQDAQVYQNFLPNFNTTMSTFMKSELAKRYVMYNARA